LLFSRVQCLECRELNGVTQAAPLRKNENISAFAKLLKIIEIWPSVSFHVSRTQTDARLRNPGKSTSPEWIMLAYTGPLQPPEVTTSSCLPEHRPLTRKTVSQQSYFALIFPKFHLATLS